MRTQLPFVLAFSAFAFLCPAKEAPQPKAAADDAKKTAEPPPTRILHFKILTNAIAITFDDGPDPKNTPRLLEILKERGIKATFYLLGRSVNTYPQIVRQIIADGHEIGNHTWDHKDLSKMSDANCIDELQKTQDAIIAAGGGTPATFRPPYGNVKMSQRKEIMEKFHYPTIIWEVDTEDWKKPYSSEKVHNTILKDTKAGSIILCHDIHAWTIDAMPATLDELKAKGFQFKTISEMIQLEQDERSGKVPMPTTTTTTTPTSTTKTPPATTAPSAKTPTIPQAAQPAQAQQPPVPPPPVAKQPTK